MYKREIIRGLLVSEREIKGKELHLEVRPKSQRRKPNCPNCGSKKIRSKGLMRRKARHLAAMELDCYLHVTHQRYKCHSCGKTFNPTLPGVRPGKQSTEPFREKIAQQHRAGIPCSVMADMMGIGAATVERCFLQYTKRKAAERISLQCPIILGIDEHTLHKKQRFATTLCDLRNHRIFDVFPGKSAKDLEPYFARLEGREKVKIVCIDLSQSYRSLVETWFPNAQIVADRFHVIRLMLHHFITLCRDIMGEYRGKNKACTLLRTNPENLSVRGRLRLEALFLEFPALKAIYDEIQQLHRLLNRKSQTKRQCRILSRLLLRAIDRLQQSGFQALMTLAATLKAWAGPIACMWRSTKNGYPENMVDVPLATDLNHPC